MLSLLTEGIKLVQYSLALSDIVGNTIILTGYGIIEIHLNSILEIIQIRKHCLNWMW